MDIKKEIELNFSDEKEKNNLRYSSAKIILIFIICIFFITFYFLGAKILEDFFKKIISPLYILLIFNIYLFTFLLVKKFFHNKKFFGYIINIIFFLISIFFILPIIL